MNKSDGAGPSIEYYKFSDTVNPQGRREVPRAQWRGASVFSPARLTQRSLIPLALPVTVAPTFRVGQHPKQ